MLALVQGHLGCANITNVGWSGDSFQVSPSRPFAGWLAGGARPALVDHQRVDAHANDKQPDYDEQFLQS